MPLTKLDTTAALIVIDLQKGIVGLPTVHPAGEIVANEVCRSSSSTWRAALRAVPMLVPPSSRFRRTGPSSYLNWSGNPAIIS